MKYALVESFFWLSNLSFLAYLFNKAILYWFEMQLKKQLQVFDVQ